jgi:hypothetical protein
MTREEAERQFRRQMKRKAEEKDWLNDPRSWEESDRPLTPSEISYAAAALRKSAA